MIFHCFHGFLGRGADWDPIFLGEKKVCPSLFEPAQKDFSSLDEAGGWVNAQATEAGPRILIGYSLGGRIALHSLIQNPELWSAAIIVSAHPGLSADDPQRSARLAADQAWARRFREEVWDDVLKDWNAQPVFRGGDPDLFSRNEEGFSRELLAGALEKFSLATQKDLRPQLAQLKAPILWISGEHDAKFRVIASQFANTVVISGAGHRVPWEQTEKFRKVVQEFVSTIYKE